MYPRLVAISGPLEGAVFALSDGETWIGRDPANHICLAEPLVSRKHCRIRQEENSFRLYDDGSSNGTSINEVPVRERLLAEGDRIKIGDSQFLFLISEAESLSLKNQVVIDEDQVITRTTVLLPQTEAVYLQHDRVATLATSSRLANNLNALLKISRTISLIRPMAELQQRLLELIFEVIPADSGAIILSKNIVHTDSFAWLNRNQNTGEPLHVSRTVVERVMREKVAILSNDVAENLSLKGVSSILRSRVQSLLCVPLALFEIILGVIYLDSKNKDVKFDEDHLQLLTAIAGIAAVAFDNARHIESLESETRRLQSELTQGHDLIGESAPMRTVYQLISKVAPSDSTVLIRGESGTGKELAARAIHNLGLRSKGPFIAINCAGLSDTLLESDLFGHEKGAFTGAVTQKKGKLEVANGGTVFLDELGELPLPLQAKLLRVLQTREFERVGGTRTIKTDIRIIAATNRDLDEAIRNGTFRSDLYYRLNVVSLMMPSLRDRREDILLLSQYFATKYSQKCKRVVKGLAPETKALLVNYDWPGNVRELENAIERAVVLGSTEMILPEDLPEVLHETITGGYVSQTKYHTAAREAKCQIILNTLEQNSWNFTQSAKILGIHPNNLHRLVRNLGLR